MENKNHEQEKSGEKRKVCSRDSSPITKRLKMEEDQSTTPILEPTDSSTNVNTDESVLPPDSELQPALPQESEINKDDEGFELVISIEDIEAIIAALYHLDLIPELIKCGLKQ